MKTLRTFAALLIAASTTVFAQKPTDPPLAPVPDSVTFAPANPALPAIFLVGDSTAEGYGPMFVPYFDPAKVNVIPAGIGGRSERTYMNQGIWTRVLKQVRPHDIVLFQMGHNDASPISDTNRCRGDIPGLGEETQEVDNPLTHQHEVVHTFGWYMRQYIRDVQAKGATIIVMSLTSRDVWKDGHMVRDSGGYAGWAASVAKDAHVEYVDINSIIAAHFDEMGQEKAKALYKDNVHQTPEGWELYAAWITSGLKAMPDAPFDAWLSAKGKAVPAAK
jgi:lysophospholipase L1-like esterase